MHSESQLLFYCFGYSGTESSMCSRTSLAMTDTTDCSATYGKWYLVPTLLWSHFFPTIAAKHFSPWNAEWQITLNQSHLSLLTVSTSQATHQKSTEFGGAWLHSTNYKAAWKHEHVCTFIIVMKLTEAQGELGQIQACGYKDCNEHIFHVQVNIFSYQISNCSQFRLRFRIKELWWKTSKASKFTFNCSTSYVQNDTFYSTTVFRIQFQYFLSIHELF